VFTKGYDPKVIFFASFAIPSRALRLKALTAKIAKNTRKGREEKDLI
jgi:hypothetical protein